MKYTHGGSDGKESACNAGDLGLITGSILWRGEWQSTPVFLSGEFHGQRSLVGYSPWNHKESDTTEWLTLFYFPIHTHTHTHIASLVAQTVKSLPTVPETQVWSLSREDPLEKEMANYSSILAWKTPWIEEPSRLQSMGSQRVGHDWATSLSLFTHIYVYGHI